MIRSRFLLAATVLATPMAFTKENIDDYDF